MGSPHIQPRIYNWLKANAGQQFSPSEIAHKALGRKPGNSSISNALHCLCKAHPSTMVRTPIGKTGRLATYGYKKANGSTAAALAPHKGAPATTSGDVLITIPIGDGKTSTLDLPAARKVYDQLNALFGLK